MMSRRNFKLWIYCGSAVCSTAISGLSASMFGDGTIDWAHWRFAWVLFIFGVATSIFNVLRAALDQETSSTTPPTAIVPITQTQIPNLNLVKAQEIIDKARIVELTTKTPPLTEAEQSELDALLIKYPPVKTE